tara:strand:+ start:439 stop:882 length:444 start_codon:yes stop_codon:yes gene_type:complete
MAKENKSKDSKSKKVAVKKKTAKEVLVKEKVAFKDFKKSVTKKEFEAVLKVVNEEYDKMIGVIKSSIEFDNKIDDNIESIKAESGDIPFELTKKLIEGLKIKGKKEVIRLFGDQIMRSNEITDFINKFQLPGEEKPYLDFSFLKDVK